MNQHKNTFRLTALLTVVAIILGIYVFRLQNVQIAQAKAAKNVRTDTYTYYTRVTAARGELLDCKGKVLIGNRASFNVVLINPVLFSAEKPNELLRRLTNLCDELGLELNDHFPVSQTKPYTYTTDDYPSKWKDYFKKFLAAREWDSDISAPQLVLRMRERYNIPDDWTEEEARRVISVRYELDLRYCTNLPTYVLIEDIDSTSLAELTELNIPGMNVETSTVREYHTTLAAHILGYVGKMDKDQYEKYKDKGYAMDAQVGQSGLELAFEEQLHGTDGMRETTIDSKGNVIEEHYVQEPVAGNNVELTLDLDLQQVAEKALEDKILQLRETGSSSGTGKDAEGGAIVAMDVKTGRVLACASYPTYDINSYFKDYNELKEQEDAPLFNRVLQATYPPGSTYKLVTMIAAVDNNIIDRNYLIEDEGVYMRFADQAYFPRCMLYTSVGATHGTLNPMQAIAKSCNYYFYEIGYLTGIDKIDEVGKAMGLGEETGIELPEKTGARANPETKARIYEGSKGYWYGTDTVQAAIGQSENRYTPLQLCVYCSTLANRGTRYKATLLSRVMSSDYEQLLYKNEPEILGQLEISDEAYYIYTTGMHMTTLSGGTASGAYRGYSIDVCAKTGTAEHGSLGSDHGAFMVYAPMDDPQIAVYMYVEKAGGGGFLGDATRSVLDAYFAQKDVVDTVRSENTLN